MSQRRNVGDGSIFQEGNGWVVLLELPRKPNGKRHRRKQRAKSKAEAQRLLRQMKADYQDMGAKAFSNRTISETLSDYNELRQGKKVRSITDSEQRFGEIILNHLGRSSKTREISVQDCDELLAAFVGGSISPSGRPVSRSYAKQMRGYLSGALKNDVRRGFINQNVAELAEVPSSAVESKSMRALSKDEWRALFRASSGVTKIAVDLSGRHGLRPQEVRSVLWSELDLDRLTVSVTSQFDSDDNLRDPKTSRSSRTIPLHVETAEALGKWRGLQQGMRQKAGERWKPSDLVLTTRWGTPINRNNHLRAIAKACAKAGIAPIVPYELRHTAITHQIDAGHSPSRVADWAGTSEEMIYRYYRHKIRELTDLAPTDYGEAPKEAPK